MTWLDEAWGLAEDGLLDITPLTVVMVTKAHDGVQCSDREFLDHVAARLRASFTEHRLVFRLLMLAAVREAGLAEGDDDEEGSS